MKSTTGSRGRLARLLIASAVVAILICSSCVPNYVALPESKLILVLEKNDQIVRDGVVVATIEHRRIALSEGDYHKLLDDAQTHFGEDD